MAYSEMSDNKDVASYIKVAQLHAAIKSHLDINYIERILLRAGNTIRQVVVQSGASFKLLYTAYSNNQLDIFQIFLDHGADYTGEDNENRTVIHKIMHETCNELKSSDDRFDNPFVHAILSAHMKYHNIANPCCKYGVSHFHAACMTNQVEAVEFFLENGVSVDEAVNADSPIFAGFTPLHFAVRYSGIETVEILLKYGAKLHVESVSGMSPMFLLIERKIKGSTWSMDENMMKLLLNHNTDVNAVDYFGLSNLHAACLLKDTSNAENILAEESLYYTKHAINMDSPICPGYTPLHFAFTFNINSAKLLLMKRADIETKDANDVTPFDLCLQKHSVEDIHYVISNQTKWKDVTLSDGRTRLLDVLSAMESEGEFNKFLANIESMDKLTVPGDSPLWPGYTILHLAVICSKECKDESNYYGFMRNTEKVEKCLSRGADITKTDANNSTALHLAFYLQKFATVELLLKHHLTIENPFDSNNLSHFHIACAACCDSAVERFLSGGCIDVNIPIKSMIKWNLFVYSSLEPTSLCLTPGSTALHINVACGNVKITKMLLENGANICAKDCNGFTPVHRLFTSRTTHFREGIDDLLLNVDGLRDSFAECGLSHLHVACYLDKFDAIENLLDAGADVNAIITYKGKNSNNFDKGDDNFYDPYGDPSKEPLSFLSRYADFTPLHFALQACNTDAQMLLIKRGADVMSAIPCKNLPPIDEQLILPILTDLNSVSSNRLRNQLGMTILHDVCCERKLALAEELLLQGVDVNMKCPFSPRNTPLHFAVKGIVDAGYESSIVLIKLLLKYGADVTLKNDNGNNPLDLLDRTCTGYLTDYESARLLLKSVKDFNVSNSQEMSFFHYACMMKDVKMVEKFLQNGIDVNIPVDYFADRYAGCSPLHFAAGYRSKHFDDDASQIRIMELLLKHGADVHAVDVYGNTTLHSAANCDSSSEIFFDILIRHGADVNAENIFGETPLETLIKSENANWNEVQCLLKYGAHVNSHNPITQEGYFAKLFNNLIVADRNILANDIIRNLIISNYITEIGSDGRNFLHSIVSTRHYVTEDYVELIGQLVNRECHIDHQDNEGKTPLHVAMWFRNGKGVLGLIMNGADVNITDDNGKTAFAYALESPLKSYTDAHNADHVISILTKHVHKMEYCGLYLSEDIRRFKASAMKSQHWEEEFLRRFDKIIKTIKSVTIGSSGLTLFDFVKNAEMVYPNMSLSVRLEIDQFFENIKQHDLYELDYLLKLKFEKARERLRLINSAVVPFGIIIKNQLPELCCRVILSFLSVADLKNVIETEKL